MQLIVWRPFVRHWPAGWPRHCGGNARNGAKL